VPAFSGQVIDWAKILDLGVPFYASPGGDYFDFTFDQDNKLWIENDGLLMVYDGSTWSTLTHANSGFSSGMITELEIDGAGNVWVGTPTGINVFRAQGADASRSQVSKFWVWLRSDLTANPPAIGRYWLLPFFLSLFCFALFFQPGNRLTALSLLLGGLMFFVTFGFIFLGYFYAANILMLPLGLLGAVISVIALLPFAKQERRYRHLARIGLTIALIWILVSLALRLLILVVPV